MSCSISVIVDFIDLHFNGGGKEFIGITKQLCKSAAAFGNAVVNAVLCCFYDGKKKFCCKGFHICGLFFQVLQCC